jgi:hypothetical protein
MSFYYGILSHNFRYFFMENIFLLIFIIAYLLNSITGENFFFFFFFFFCLINSKVFPGSIKFK